MSGITKASLDRAEAKTLAELDAEQSRELAEARAQIGSRDAMLDAMLAQGTKSTARLDALRIAIAKHRDELKEHRRFGDLVQITDMVPVPIARFSDWQRELDEALAADDASAGGVVAESATSECACVCPVGNPDCSKCGVSTPITAEELDLDKLAELEFGAHRYCTSMGCADVKAALDAFPSLVRAARELAALKAAYDELLYEVAQKYEGETRHQTALRYIRERENRPLETGTAATPPTSNPDDFDLRTWNPGNWDLGGV